jgi:hypothetical protein
MAFECVLEEGEDIIANLSYIQDSKHCCRIVFTSRALFVPRQKAFAVRDPSYAERIPFNRVVEVRIQKLKPYYLLALAALMIVVGSVTTVLMLMPALRGESYTLSGYPPAIAVVGVVIPFIARRRYGLSIAVVGKGFFWKPPLNIDSASRQAADVFLSDIAAACAKAGLPTRDEREGSSQVTKVQSANYPEAPVDSETTRSAGVLRNCCRCGAGLRIPRWDAWNGFLFRCGNCRQVHGKSWNGLAVVLGSLFLNSLSFFFTFRWRLALALFGGFVGLDFALAYTVDHLQIEGNGQLVMMGVMFLGPLIINSVALLRHEVDLKTAVAVRA